jgi:hypothetical protein
MKLLTLNIVRQVPGSILYGFYALVFILCITALNRKRRSGLEAGYRFQILSISILFTLTTGYMIIRVFSLNDGLLPLLTDDEQLGVATSQEMLSFSILWVHCFRICANEHHLTIFTFSIMADGILVSTIVLLHKSVK